MNVCATRTIEERSKGANLTSLKYYFDPLEIQIFGQDIVFAIFWHEEKVFIVPLLIQRVTEYHDLQREKTETSLHCFGGE